MLKKHYLRIIGLVILVIFYLRWDFSLIVSHLKQVDILFFTGSIVCVNCVVLLQAWRGYILLGREKGDLDFLSYARYYFVTMAASMASPGRVGAVTQIPLLYQRGISLGNGVANVIYDKLCDLTGFLAMGAVFTTMTERSRIVNPLLLGCLFGLTMFAMWYLDSIFAFGIRWVERVYPKFNGIRYMKRPELESHTKIAALNLTLVRLFGAVGIHWFVATSLSMSFSLIQLAAAAALGALSTLLPVSIMGVGLRESVFLLLLSGYGYTAEQLLTFAFLVLMAYLSTILVGIGVALASGRREDSGKLKP